ncbi:MAG: type II CRISPR RNA-guided endonuclease Cas9 [Burkholderiaceae bacterium]
MLPRMKYRLALDIGTNSIGWCLIRLKNSEPPTPIAVIRAGVRVFPDGREPARGKGEVGTSLAATRRQARAMRRRRDRLLKRKARLQDALIRLGFWPRDDAARKALVTLDPYRLRSDGLDKPLTPAEFGRALFHLNQRRGFQSNRKTDRKDSESGLLKTAIRRLRETLAAEDSRTVGEWLAKRHASRQSVRARLRGRSVKDRAYDLYIDRAMVADEFDRLWSAQAAFDAATFDDAKRAELRDILLHQRSLHPVRPGRCTLMSTEERAPLALPSTQRFRMFQELNNLRLMTPGLQELPLSREQRDKLAGLLEQGDVTFTRMLKALKLPGTTKFNLQDVKRDRLKGNATTKALAGEDLFGERWRAFDLATQDDIVVRLLDEASESALVAWLIEHTEVDEARAERIANTGLPEGFGNLSRAALARVLPELEREVVTYDVAVVRSGFESHSALSHADQTGEVMLELPYYGEPLQRHVGFADPKAKGDDPPEKRFGRIANPTVHIGLNELRKVVNGLIARYGHPSEVVVEVARELKQGRQQRKDEHERQAERQAQNDIWREQVKSLPGWAPREVSALDLQRMRLWHELNPQDAANRRCPYTGEQIGMAKLFSSEVEVDHILPFSMTLDDSLNNKVVALRRANRDKGNRPPFEAFGHSPAGYDYEAILQRAALMPRDKAKRFAADGYQRWLREDKDFLARALTDTAYLSRIAKEYLSLICPPNKVRVIPGRLTAMLRGKFGLNKVLSREGDKNRDDHRHHAVDAAVIGVTDQGLLQRFAQASAAARSSSLDRLVDEMPLPWPTYREHVARAVAHIVVSHKPDHGHEGALHNDTAYGLRADGEVTHRVMLDSFKSAKEIEGKTLADDKLKQWLLEKTAGLSGKEFALRVEQLQREHGIRRVKVIEKLAVIPIADAAAIERHGTDVEGQPRAYKGYKGDSNYCIEIWRDEKSKWRSKVISTFAAGETVRQSGGSSARLRHPKLSQDGQALVMRLMIGDTVKVHFKGAVRIMQVRKIKSIGSIFLAEHQEANVRAREDAGDESLVYGSFSASSLQSGRGRAVSVSPIGDLRDPGFSG